MGEKAVSLRQWRDEDLEPFAAMNTDPEVMRYFLNQPTREETAATMRRLRQTIDESGWGVWVVDVDGEFAGYTGLYRPTFTAHFTPCVEIMWRLHQRFWGQSIAYRAAQLAEDYAARTMKLPELVAFTTETNLRSRKLMERLGFTRNAADDFRHPAVPVGHALERHVLYRKKLN